MSSSTASYTATTTTTTPSRKRSLPQTYSVSRNGACHTSNGQNTSSSQQRALIKPPPSQPLTTPPASKKARNEPSHDNDNPKDGSSKGDLTDITAGVFIPQQQDHDEPALENSAAAADSAAVIHEATPLPDKDNKNVSFSSSFEEFLSVPLEYIFRHVQSTTNTSSNKKPPLWLSRNEAHCFLTISTVATDLDSLLDVSTKLLGQQSDMEAFRAMLNTLQQQKGGGGGYWASLGTISHVVGETLAHAALTRIQQELNTVLHKLQTSILIPLQQSSDQNWTTYESLADSQQGSTSMVNAVALEKRYLAELQDELIRRIEWILGQSSFFQPEEEGHTLPEGNEDEATTHQTMRMMDQVSMADFCQALFSGGMETDTEPMDDDTDEQQQQQQQQQDRTTNGTVPLVQQEVVLRDTSTTNDNEDDGLRVNPPTTTALVQATDDPTTTTSQEMADRTTCTQNAAEALSTLFSSQWPT